MEKPYEFHKKLTTVHRPHRVNPAVYTKIHGTLIDRTWKIIMPEDAGIVLQNAVKDLKEYFAVSMDLKLDLIVANEYTLSKCIVYSLDNSLEERTYHVSCGIDRIVLSGCDERYLAQAGYTLEDLLNRNEGPVLERGNLSYHVRFTPRIIHGGLAHQDYPDEHLRMLAHYGYNCIPLDSDGILDDPKKQAKARDVIARAAKYGIDVFTFSPFHNERHPDDPNAYDYYNSRYGRLIDLMKGVRYFYIVGECCEFPSHDKRTTGRPWRESLKETKSSPGWFPCNDYPEFVTLLNRIIHNHDPNCELIFWTYNWGYEKESLREALMRNVPTDITMQATFEMFEKHPIKPGVEEVCTDYTLWDIGPGQYFTSESRIARERGIKMYGMTNTGGNTWDIGDVQYLPCPQRWIQRWNAVCKAQDELRLDGLMESHTYGFWPSILPELAKYAYMQPQPDMNALLRRLVVRDFGENNADTVLRAYALFGNGISHCVSTNEDQYGPARIGPSYPLVFKRYVSIPVGPQSTVCPDFEANPIYRYNLDLTDKLLYEADEYHQMACDFEAGCLLLRTVADKAHQAAFTELLNVAQFIGNTAKTIEHVKRWHHLKGQLGIYLDTEPVWVGGRKNMPDAAKAKKPLECVPDPNRIVSQMLQIAYAELANAKATIPIVEADSRIGYCHELDYCASPEQLRWKIAELEKTIKEELMPLL